MLIVSLKPTYQEGILNFFNIPLGYKSGVPVRSTTAVRVGSSGKLGLVLQVVILRAYARCIFLRKHNFARDSHEYLKSIHSQFDS